MIKKTLSRIARLFYSNKKNGRTSARHKIDSAQAVQRYECSPKAIASESNESSNLGQEIYIPSDLAVDLEGYDDFLEKEVKDNNITQQEADQLGHFAQHGYTVLEIGESKALLDEFVDDVDRLWEERSEEVLGATPDIMGGKLSTIAELMSIAQDQGISARSPKSRLTDHHSYSEAARQLFLHPKIHRFISLILEQPCVATQSLYFDYGSGQSLHRDPWFVVTDEVKNLVACWIALEDISLDAGPLMYVPGSHRYPFLKDDKGNIILHAPHVDWAYKQSVYDHMHAQIKDSSHEPVAFTAKKGQVFVWHGCLVHGGSKIIHPELTRKSFVVHFDTLASAEKKGARYMHNGNEIVAYTTEKYFENGCYGFRSPLSAGK